MKTLSLSVILLAGCVHGVALTQVMPTTGNQMYMVTEVQRLQPMLNMGEFVAIFTYPPEGRDYAGWAPCQLNGGGESPWPVYFNEAYVETLTSRGYMSELVAHEMCHHWVHKKTSTCGVEALANKCAQNLLLWGRPE